MSIFASLYLLPPVALVVPLALAVLWLARRVPRRRRGWIHGLCQAVAVVALLATLPAVHKGLSWPVRTLVPDWDEAGRPPVGAVVVPTGGSFADSNDRRWPSRETVRRVALGAALAEDTGLPLAVSGGSPEEEPFSEAALAVDLLDLERSAVMLDTTARNTHENAGAFRRLLEPRCIRSVVVVTDSIHLARMAASLRAVGFRVYGHGLGLNLDQPVEAADFAPSNRGLGYMHKVASGYAGILYYLVRGRFTVSDLLGNGREESADAPPA